MSEGMQEEELMTALRLYRQRSKIPFEEFQLLNRQARQCLTHGGEMVIIHTEGEKPRLELRVKIRKKRVIKVKGTGEAQ